MIHVHVGNTSPNLIFEKGNLFIGQSKKDLDIPMIITDLWGVSIIEECSFLEHLINSGLSKVSALNLLQDLKNEENIHSITIPKGLYILKFSANVEEFQKLYKKQYKNSKLPTTLNTFFTFEKVKKKI